MNVTQRNSLQQTITQAIDKMKKESGHKDGTPFKVNLAELGRRTGLSRKTLRNLQKNDFVVKPHGNTGRHKKTVLSAFTSYIDGLLSQSVSNSAVIYRNMLELGYTGGKSQVKAYIKEHRYLVPIPRASVAPQGDRGVRYQTDPGEMFQMDWGFVNVERSNGKGYRAACFVMVCHHCGKCYIEFFPNAKQENLFIGMIHAFQRLGIPECVLTDNMKSVVTGRDPNGKPIWNKEYETFMNDVGFATKLCKARHPFTKGKVERLVRFVKDNFMNGRSFTNITLLNLEALRWCDEQDGIRHQGADYTPGETHAKHCMQKASAFVMTDEIRAYLRPVRRISFDGFVCYEGRRFGVPCSYKLHMCRVEREGFNLNIFSYKTDKLLVTHKVTWSRVDSTCPDQYKKQPEEFPTEQVKVSMHQVFDSKSESDRAFDRFNFDTEGKRYA